MRLGRLILLLSAGIASLYGQGTTGTLVGTVKDSSGAIVAGAIVTVTNQGTNTTRNTTTTQDGEYSVPLLPPGTYDVAIKQPGFRDELYKNVTLDVDQTARVDSTLSVGTQAETVNVDAAAPLINTDTSTIGQVISDQSVNELPLNNRNFVGLAYLTPGAALPTEGTTASTQGLSLSVNGKKDNMNNYMIDGVDDNDTVIGQYSAIPSMDAIQEFKVETGNYSAEYGRSAGGQVNVLLKSGTNEYHGTGYEFVRNRNMDAKNFFDQPACTATSVPGTCGPIPRLDRSQAGGSIGGPVQKNKTFFFIAFEYLNQRSAVTEEATVPSQVQRAAALAAVPASLINPAGLNTLNLYPAANVGSNLQTSNTFVSAPTSSQTTPYYVGKGDRTLGDKDTINGHFVASWYTTQNAFDPISPYTFLPGYGTEILQHGQNVGISWTHIFSPKLINIFTAGYNGEDGEWRLENNSNITCALGYPDVTASVPGIPRTTCGVTIMSGAPNIAVAGFSGIGDDNQAPEIHPTYTPHISEHLSLNPDFDGGRHQLKFGFDTRYYMYQILWATTAPRGLWAFNGSAPTILGSSTNSLEQLLVGQPSYAEDISNGNLEHFRQHTYAGYIQDDYHVSQSLTLNLGLRYDYNGPQFDPYNELSIPNLSTASATCTPKPNCQFIVAGTDGLSRSTYHSYYKNFQPRVGFAWRPLKTDRFVIRSAGGIYTDTVTILGLSVGLQVPFRSNNLVQNPTGVYNDQNILEQPPTSILQTATFIDPKFRDPYYIQWNMDAEYTVAKNMLLDVGYVGTKGVHINGSQNLNQPNIGQTAPYPYFGSTVSEVSSDRWSIYNALQAKLEKRGTNWALLAAYTWSRSIDDTNYGGAGGGSTPQYAYDLAAEKGLSSFNANQRIVISYLYNLPMGTGHSFAGNGWPSRILSHWQLTGIFSAQTGQPFTVNDVSPQSGTLPSGSADRPDVVGNPMVAGPVAGNPTCVAPTQVGIPSMWFNPCAFLFVKGQFGDEGRNALVGPGYTNWDASLMKTVTWSEKRRLELRFEGYNIFNHPNFDFPDRLLGDATFGTVLSSNGYGGRPPRQIQLGAKFYF
jgi:Carboxypeptidase regulatory-like domain/TonB dependent receptor